LSKTTVVPQSNSLFEFLIVLYPDDLYWTYVKCVKVSKKKYFMKQSKYMNGFLHIRPLDNLSNISMETKPVCECCNKPYSIRGLITRRMLYAKLPKEGIYVSVNNWYHEYLKSQMLELLYIFRMLGADTITLQLQRSTDESKSIDVSTNISGIFSDLNVTAGIKDNHVTKNDDSIDLSATYEKDDNFKPYNSFDSFLKDDTIYYLTQNQDWQDFIAQRIDCKIKDLNFKFTVANNLQVDKTFYANVKQMGFNLDVKTEDDCSFTVSGTVNF